MTDTAGQYRLPIPYRLSSLLFTGLCAALLSLAPATGELRAEVIQVPVGQQGASRGEITLPRRGLSKDAVLKQFGQPTTWTDAVGTPPISTWEYPDFTVYFEDDYVIHAVKAYRPEDGQRTIRQSAPAAEPATAPSEDAPSGTDGDQGGSEAEAENEGTLAPAPAETNDSVDDIYLQ